MDAYTNRWINGSMYITFCQSRGLKKLGTESIKNKKNQLYQLLYLVKHEHNWRDLPEDTIVSFFDRTTLA